MSSDFENINFDRLIRQKFVEHKTDVPEHLWANIDRATFQSKINVYEKRIFWYRWLTASLVLILFGVILFYQFNDIPNKNTNQISETDLKDNTKTDKNRLTLTIKDKENQHINQKNKAQKHTTVSETKKLNKINAVSTSKKPISDALLNKETKQSAISEKNALQKNEEFNQQELTINNQDSLITNNSTTIQHQIQNTIEPKNLSIEDKIDTTELSLNKTVVNTIENNLITQDLFVDSGKLANAMIDTTSFTNSSDSILTDTITASNLLIADESKAVTPEKKLSRLSISLLLNSAFSTVGFDVKNKSSSIYNSPQRNNLQFSAAADIGYQISNKFSLKIGIEYRKFTNEFSKNNARPNDLPLLINANTNSVTINSALGTVTVDDVGDFSFAGDDEDDVFLDDEDDFADLNYKEKYSFTSIDLPLTLDYVIGNRKLKFLMGGGLLTSFVINNNSKIEVSNVYSSEKQLEVENFNDTKKITLGGKISIGLKYDLSKRFSLLLLPSFSASFFNINNNDASEIKPSSKNFYTGILVHL